MRKLVALLATLAFLPVAKAADSKADFSANAEFRLRYQYDQNISGQKDADTAIDDFNHRLKMDFGFKSGEKFAAKVTLIHNALWGDAGATNSAAEIPDGIGNANNMVLVNQAYGTWMMNDAWTLKFGRGGLNLADGSVISQNDWEAVPHSYEGLLTNWEHEMMRLNLFVVRAEDALTSANGNDDPQTTFFGGAVDVKHLPEFIKTLNVHLLQLNADERTIPGPAQYGKSVMRYGLVLGGDMSGFDYKLDYAANDGKARVNGTKIDLKGQMYHLDLGFSMPEMMKSRVHFAYHSDTGDKSSSATKDESYDAFHYDRHGAAGLMDVFGWGNLTFINLGFTAQPMDQLEVGLHYWKFDMSEANATPTAGLNGGDFVNGGSASTSKALGQEIDLAATKKYDGGLAMTAWAGMFMPGTFFKDNSQKDTYTQIFLEGKMTF